MKEEGRGGSYLDLDLNLDPDPDPWKILWIRIRQNDADPDRCLARHYIGAQNVVYITNIIMHVCIQCNIIILLNKITARPFKISI